MGSRPSFANLKRRQAASFRIQLEYSARPRSAWNWAHAARSATLCALLRRAGLHEQCSEQTRPSFFWFIDGHEPRRYRVRAFGVEVRWREQRVRTLAARGSRLRPAATGRRRLRRPVMPRVTIKKIPPRSALGVLRAPGST